MLGVPLGLALGDVDPLGLGEVLGGFENEGAPEGNGDVLG